jgi:hypothetical protein
MHPLTVMEIEVTAGVGQGRIDVLKRRGQLPFKDKNKPFTIQKYSPFHALALNLQGALCEQFAITPAEAAIVVNATSGALYVRWRELVEEDLWVAICGRPKPGKKRERNRKVPWDLAALVLSRAELLEFIKAPLDAAARAEVRDGMRHKELFKTFAQDPLRRIWPLHASGVFHEMLERATANGVTLPPGEDVVAWCEVKV